MAAGSFRQWRATPVRAQLYTAGVVLFASEQVVTGLGVARPDRAHLATLVLLIAGAVVNIELGRRIEGGRLERDRQHKGLSAWPFTAALLLPAGYAGLVALISYAFMRRRGIRMPLWKWTISWAAVTLASVAAGRTMTATGGLPGTGNPIVIAAVIASAGVFVLTEAAIYFGISRLNAASDEGPLRRSLASRDFYLTEVVVLATAAIAAVLIRYTPVALLLTVPGFITVQRAVLHQALRQEARCDAKTGLLNSETWRSEASAAWERGRRTGTPFTVLIVDLDHFKRVNDTYGHLAGDEVLVAVAAALVASVRKGDLVGRFGGEEFCVALPGIDDSRALDLAERVRVRLSELRFTVGPLRITTSVGVACRSSDGSVAGKGGAVVDEMLAAADAALYRAKRDGRNLVRNGPLER